MSDVLQFSARAVLTAGEAVECVLYLLMLPRYTARVYVLCRCCKNAYCVADTKKPYFLAIKTTSLLPVTLFCRHVEYYLQKG